MAEFRLVTDEVSSSLWELVDKELAVRSHTGQVPMIPNNSSARLEARDICPTNIMDISAEGNSFV